ncbi:unnamed protein product [Arctia plantaginis]|uniref:Uncharacterized protein n=1 Tax=Arctia plantaginis TaxID=874455 RepID=A0A8S1B534_ARCPL|nr:unnamed protein product [Arctia plantaginis]
MGTELPKTQDSSGDTDSNSDSENSSSSASSRSEWECSDSKLSPNRKAHFSVTSCDTGLKLKIAAIPPRKVSPKRITKPSTAAKKKVTNNETQSKDRPSLKNKSQLSDSSSSSDSCSKCSSNSSSDDDIPLKTVSKNLPSKCAAKTPPKVKQTNKSDNDEGRKQCDVKDNTTNINNKDKPSATKTNNVKKTKSGESNHDTTLKRSRGRPRTKLACRPWCTSGSPPGALRFFLVAGGGIGVRGKRDWSSPALRN